MKIKKKQNESLIQSQCVYWFKIQYPNKIIYAIPNGGSRSKFQNKKTGKWFSPEAQRMKREGVLPGVPDLFVAEPTSEYHGLYIEMKDGTNTPSDAQRDLISALIFRGYACVVCYSLDEFMQIIKDYFK